MKQIINGRLYDTDKAKLLCESHNLLAERYKLYITNSGIFFFQMQRPFSKEYYLLAVEECDIKNLLAEKNPDAYIELFGEVEEA